MEIVNIIEKVDYENVAKKNSFADISDVEFDGDSILLFIVYFIPSEPTLAYRKVFSVEFEGNGRNFEDLGIISDEEEAIFYTVERDKAGNTHNLPLTDDWQEHLKDLVRNHLDIPVILSINSE